MMGQTYKVYILLESNTTLVLTLESTDSEEILDRLCERLARNNGGSLLYKEAA